MINMFRIVQILTIISFSTACSIFNSGTISIKRTETKANFYGKNYSDIKKWTDVSFSIRRIQHPKKYGEWNINLGLSPSIHLDRSHLGLDDPTVLLTKRHLYPDVKIKRLSTLGNLKLILHTPIGAFAASAGIGIAGYYAHSSTMNTYRTRQIRRIDLVWVGFLSKRLFILTGPRWYFEKTWQYVWAFRIGCFWGKIK